MEVILVLGFFLTAVFVILQVSIDTFFEIDRFGIQNRQEGYLKTTTQTSTTTKIIKKSYYSRIKDIKYFDKLFIK
jgi:hypothetical protein